MQRSSGRRQKKRTKKIWFIRIADLTNLVVITSSSREKNRNRKKPRIYPNIRMNLPTYLALVTCNSRQRNWTEINSDLTRYIRIDGWFYLALMSWVQRSSGRRQRKRNRKRKQFATLGFSGGNNPKSKGYYNHCLSSRCEEVNGSAWLQITQWRALNVA